MLTIGSNVFGDSSGAALGPRAFFFSEFPAPAGTGRAASSPSSKRGAPMAQADVTSSPGVCATAGRASRSLSARRTPRHARRVTRAAST